jgi:hypothetical protein
MFHHNNMRNLAVVICSVVATPECTRSESNINFYNIYMTNDDIL